MTDKKSDDKDGLNIDFGLGKIKLGGIFDGIEKLIDLAGKLEEAGGEIKKEGNIRFGKKDGKDLKGVFGFSIKNAMGGKPVVEHFGNIRKSAEGPVVEEEREPITDIFDENKEIIIMAEMPGVSTKDIRIDIKGDILEISAKNECKNYHKEILLKTVVKPECMKQNYRNGILEIKITKAVQAVADAGRSV